MEKRGVNRNLPAEIVRTFSWVPMWPGIVFLPVWLVFFGATMLSTLDSHGATWRAILLPFPLFFVFGCGILAFFNRTTARVSVTGVRVTTGPLPFTLPDVLLTPAEIQSTYSREVFRSPKGGGNYFAAGVRTRDGHHYDIFAPLATAAEAQQSAVDIGSILVAATGQGMDCTAYGIQYFPEDRVPVWRLLGWLGLFLGALIFAVLLEVTR
jgi:hypothetical protein